jgi:hypothetical protein
MVEYYSQRASDGGLLITDATAVSPLGIAYVDAPGIYTHAQVDGWKRVTNAVHAKGARIFLQLWHAGRQAHPANTNGHTPIAPSAIRAYERAAIRDEQGNIVEVEQLVPRALDTHEIAGIVERLLLRSTRGLMPTEAGQAFYERAKRAIEEADEAELAARGSAGALSGRLRVSAAVTFARLHIVPRLPSFLDRHPDLKIDIMFAPEIASGAVKQVLADWELPGIDL